MGETPLDIAVHKKNQKIVEMLEEKKRTNL